MDTKQIFTEYFRSGASTQQRAGVELEHFVLKENGLPLGYRNDGVCGILSGLMNKFDKVFYEENSILGMANPEYSLTLEPGAQIEVSISPKSNTAEILAAFDSFYGILQPELDKRNVQLCTIPVISENTLESIEMIPKKRYEYMDNYFKTSGSMGRYMMRGTASAQVSVDYFDESDFVKKFRAAYLLSPLFALCSAHEMPGSQQYLKRIEIWNNVDRARTAPPADLFDDSFGFDSYASQLLDTPAIFIPYNGKYIYTGPRSIKSLADEYITDIDMVEHYISMVFPDVRLKNYIEIRIADSMPMEKTAAYGGFALAVFYNPEIIEYTLNRYKGAKIADIENAKNNVRQYGFGADIYGFCAYDELMRLIELASKYGRYSDFSAFTERAEQGGNSDDQK